MPCIMCKREARLTERLLLDDLGLRLKHQYEHEYFTNWEYNYVCRRCYWRDFAQRFRGNVVGAGLTILFRFAMIYFCALVAYSLLLKQGAGPKVLFWGPVLFGTSATLLFFQHLFRVIAYLAGAVCLVVFLIYAISYADMLSFLPDMSAVMQRERARDTAERARDGNTSVVGRRLGLTGKPTPTPGSAAPSRPTTAPSDPLKASEARAARAREERVKYAFGVLDRWLPFKFDMTTVHLRLNMARALLGFALVYAVLIPFNLILLPIWRRVRERNRKQATEAPPTA